MSTSGTSNLGYFEARRPGRDNSLIVGSEDPPTKGSELALPPLTIIYLSETFYISIYFVFGSFLS